MEIVKKIAEFKDFIGKNVWYLLKLSIFLGLMWFIVELLFIYVLQSFFKSIGLAGENELFVPEFFPNSASGSLILLAGFGLFRSVVYIFKDYYTGLTNQAFMRGQRDRLLTYCLNNAAVVSKHEVITVFNERVSHCGGTILQLAIIIHTVTTSALLFFYGFSIAPLELILGLFLISLLIWPLKILDKKIALYGQGVVKESQNSNKILMLGLQNNFFLKLYNLLGGEIKKGRDSLEKYEHYFKMHYLVLSLKNAVPMFGGLLIIAIIAWISLNYTLTPKMKLLSFFYIFMRITQSVGLLAQTIANIRLHWKGLEDLLEWHSLMKNSNKDELVKEKSLNPHCDELSKVLKSDSIHLSGDDISFGFTSKRPLMSGLSFKVEQGETLLIKGPSGSGKSTLLTLITGLNKLDSGRISVNGHDVNTIYPFLRKKIAYVGPEPFLIPGSVRENLLYGNEDKDCLGEKDIWDALKHAEIDDAVKNLPLKLEEELNEITQLSTGQKQRLSLARAFLKNPKILILDEATANLDSKTEEKIINRLEHFKDDKITIIISHKDSFNNMGSEIIALG
ncbi:ABC transporter ATP-binding protein/permease [Bacteriovoracales bacterium]|nr:ABC transporter ATP-binding protein/permease [Bacteriovoracales bacterium]